MCMRKMEGDLSLGSNSTSRKSCWRTCRQADAMRVQIDKYAAKLIAARTTEAGGIGFAARDDALITCGSRDLAELSGEILSNINSLGLVAARPSIPFAD